MFYYQLFSQDISVTGSSLGNTIIGSDSDGGNNHSLARIGEDAEMFEETNPLAIVPDNHPLGPLPSPPRAATTTGYNDLASGGGNHAEVSVHRVKREEVEAKIYAWQNAKIAKVNNRFKREDAVISGWEGAQVQKATSWMKKVEVRTYGKFSVVVLVHGNFVKSRIFFINPMILPSWPARGINEFHPS